MTANKEWLKDIKISQELKDKIYYDEKNDLWVISWNAIYQTLTELGVLRRSDESKEQSSIYYFNELKRVERELKELKKRDMAMKPIEAMITWQCGKCGKEIRNTFNSCPYCGTRIDWSGIYGRNKDIENYSVRQCHDELVILESPKLPPEQSMYHDMALDVIASHKQRIKERLLRFKQSLTELEELKKLIRSLAGNHILSKLEEVFGENNSLVNQIDELKKLVGDKDE